MNFKEMSYTEFYKYIEKILLSDNYLEQIMLLAQNDDVEPLNDKFEKNMHYTFYGLSGCERSFDLLLYDNEIYGDFYNIYSSFKNLIKFKRIIDNPGNYTLKERMNIYRKMKYYTDYLIHREHWEKLVLSKEYNLKETLFETICTILGDEKYIEAYKNHYKQSYCSSETIDNALNAILAIKRYNKGEENPSKLCIDYCLNTFKNCSVKEYISILENSYFRSLFKDDSIKLYNSLSYEDLYNINLFLSKIYTSKYYLYKRDIIMESKETPETIKTKNKYYKLYLIIKKLEKENLNDYEIVSILKRDYKISFCFYSVDEAKEYAEKYFNLYDDSEKFINKIIDLKNTYINLTEKYQEIFKIMIGNDPKKELIIRIFFDFYIHSPSALRGHLLFKCKTQEEREIILNYIEEYRKYYFQKKEEEKQKKEMELIPKFEEIVKDYISSKPERKLYYFEYGNITKNEFVYMLKVLEKYNSHIIEEYKQNVKETKPILMELRKKEREEEKRERESEKEQKRREQEEINENMKEELTKVLRIMMIAKEKFTILDYYQYTKIPVNEALEFINSNMSVSQKRFFAQFHRKYSNDYLLNDSNIEELFNIKKKYIIEMDDKGNILRDYEITREDKEKVLDILTEKDILITNATYQLMLQKYFNEEILPNLNSNKKVLK